MEVILWLRGFEPSKRKKKKRKRKKRMTTSVLEQDPNTKRFKRTTYLLGHRHTVC